MVADKTNHQPFGRSFPKDVAVNRPARLRDCRSSPTCSKDQGPLALWTSLIAARNLASYFEEHDPRKSDERLTLASLQELRSLRAKGVERYDPVILSIFDDDALSKDEYDSLRAVCETHRKLILLVGHKGRETETTRLWQNFIDGIASDTVRIISHRL